VTVTLWSACAIGLVAFFMPLRPSLAQDAAFERCVFEGQARNRATQLGLGQVTIRLIPNNGSIGYEGSSKADGSFRFENVVAGDYRVEAQHTGFSRQWVLTDKSEHAISNLRLAPGQALTGNELWFTPDGAVSGKVIGPDGEPLANADVILIECRWKHGKRVYVEAYNASTDDAGVFRISSVPAGRYRVYARRPLQGPLAFSILDGPGKTETRIAARYYPNASQLDAAAAIEVRAGGEVSGIDFKLPLAPVFHIAGTYSGKDSNITLAARYGDQMLTWGGEGTVFGRDGKFETAGVIAGSYFLYSSESSPHDQLMSAKLPLTVAGQDTAGVVAPAVTRFELRGRIRIDGDAPAGKIPVRIFCDGDEADDYTSAQRHAEPQADGTFSVANLTPDRYTIRIANLYTGKDGGYYLKSLRVDGVDAAGDTIDLSRGLADVELILSAAVGGLEGTVVPPENDGSIEPTDVTLVAVPVKLSSGDSEPVSAYLDPTGHFQMTDLRPGTYRVFAVPAYDPGLWQSPEFLRQIAGRGVTVDVTEKATAKVEVHTLRASEMRQAEERVE
jgi:hypothetical protein